MGLHARDASGGLDAYRAGVVAEELEHAPAQVAAAVVAALVGHFVTEDGSAAAAAVPRPCCPGSARTWCASAPQRARDACGLRRWADEPGVDQWEGTFPSEEAARAWAAIDARARQLVADGSCPRIERARAQALIDLVTGNATIDTIITLTVPAPARTRPGPPRGVPGASLDGHPGDRPRSYAPTRPRPPATERGCAPAEFHPRQPGDPRLGFAG